MTELSAKGDSAAAADLLTGLPAVWLRANCPCPACRDPRSGQRLVAITDQPAEVTVAVLTADESTLAVRFEPDGHEAVLPRSWLAQASAAAPAEDDRAEDAKRPWLAADFAAGLPEGNWSAYRSDPEHRAWCLDTLLSVGFVLLREVPPEPEMVLAVAGAIGYVRQTNYGRLFDVKVVADPANLAFTARAIGPHTDNPYRDPVPTIQLLHCLTSAAQGGDSALLDGFAAASQLRDTDPAAFATLASTPVTFSYADAGTELRATLPMIGLTARGRIRQVRFNNRSLQPLRPAPGQDRASFAMAADEFYRAYRRFAEILAEPELAVIFKLSPGDCLVFDNTRIMHARTAFTGRGDRHLQGCYADLDSAASALAVLRRTLKG
jgi:gamma-butyrobetaine dioxygenase